MRRRVLYSSAGQTNLLQVYYEIYMEDFMYEKFVIHYQLLNSNYVVSGLTIQKFSICKRLKCKFSIIEGFHCHTIIKTIQQIKSRIKEVKEDEHSNSLAKIQVRAIFRAGDIRRTILLKFIRLCMETPCLCPSEGHKYGGRKLTKTDVIEFAIKKVFLRYYFVMLRFTAFAAVGVG